MQKGASPKAKQERIVPVQRCLWGEAVARYHGWEPERSWWYFRQPRDPGPELAEDLEGR